MLPTEAHTSTKAAIVTGKQAPVNVILPLGVQQCPGLTATACKLTLTVTQRDPVTTKHPKSNDLLRGPCVTFPPNFVKID